jgi:hypothetical protein
MPQPKQPAQSNCGFEGPDGVSVTESDLRKAVVDAARQEHTIWFPGGNAQKEDDDARFGDLVRYWLAGADSLIHPGNLELLQKASKDPAIYGNLSDASLNTAIKDFATAEGSVNTTALEVYAKSDAADVAKAAIKPARKKASDAQQKVADANARVNAARAKVLAAKTTSDSAAATTPFDQEKAALTAAQTALDTAKKNLKDTQTAAAAAATAVETAKKAHKKAIKDRDDKFKDPAQAWDKKDQRKVRSSLLAKAKGLDKQKLDDRIDSALQSAHNSRADTEAWSAVFVSSVVRSAVLAQKLEVINSKGVHDGKDKLFKVSQRHSDYVIQARDSKAATYRAFKQPGDPKVQAGDIIITDRSDFAETPVRLQDLGRQVLHGDIVTDLGSENGQAFAETIGGNVGQTVRRRRYPLKDGKLIVDHEHLIAQEDDSGKFPALTTVPSRTMLDPKSTGRIFALLSFVCKELPSAAGGQKELESPFLDEELLQLEPIIAPYPNIEWLDTPFLAPDLQASSDGEVVESLPPRRFASETPPVEVEHDIPPMPKGVPRFHHWNQPMKPDPASNSWIADGAEKTLEPIDPGFLDASGAPKAAPALDAALKNLLTGKPAAGEKIHVALVDLTGAKLLSPEFAGWGATVAVDGASCNKVAPLYAAFQLRNDLKHVAASGKITKTADLAHLMAAHWKDEGFDDPPRLLGDAKKPGLLYPYTNPPDIEFAVEVDYAIDHIIDPHQANAAARTLIDVIGFPYIASLLWQSGLRHPTQGGLWLTSSYAGGASWRKPAKPLPSPVFGHTATALSLATFFTLLGQDRLARTGLPRSIKSALSTASWFLESLPQAQIASKVGLLHHHTHEAAFIENDRFRYAVAILTNSLSEKIGIPLLKTLIVEIDGLIRANNP